MGGVTLVTGFPAFVARRIATKVLVSDGEERVVLLAREKFRAAAEQFLDGLSVTHGAGVRARASLLVGDVCDMDLGLAGAEYRALAATVTTIHHAASISWLGVPRDAATRVNVGGTRSIVELAGDAPLLARLVHWSTALVSGTRTGVVLEEELDVGQRFRNHFEETKCRAERLVQDAARRLPVTVLRPGVIIGDSTTGEIDRLDGPYYLFELILTSPANVQLPLPGRAEAPLHLVPIDFVVDAAFALSRDPRALGRTFHLVDPSPLAARTVYELVARAAGRKPPRGMIPTGLVRAVLTTPGLERLTRAPRAFLDRLDDMVLYNARNTLALLDESGVRCPPFDRYVDALVGHLRRVQSDRRERLDDDVHDALD